MEELQTYFSAVNYCDTEVFQVLVDNEFSIESIDESSVDDLMECFAEIEELSGKLEELKKALELKKTKIVETCAAVKEYLKQIDMSSYESNFAEVQFIEELLVLEKEQIVKYGILEEDAAVIEAANRKNRIIAVQKIPCLFFSRLKENGARRYFQHFQTNINLTLHELQGLKIHHLETFGIERDDFEKIFKAVEQVKQEIESERPLFAESVPRLKKIIKPLQQLQEKARHTLALTKSLLYQFPGEILLNEDLLKKMKSASTLCEVRSGIRICITGSMKAGKSTLMNELLKDENFRDILPTSSNRCTARPTIIRYGKEFKFHVGLHSTSESTNVEECRRAISLNDKDRKNRDLISQPVVIYLPSAILEIGVELIDLPGRDETDDIDQIVDEHLKQVDVIIYLFDPNYEWKKQDEQMILKLQNTNLSIPLLIVASKIDRYEAGSDSDKTEQALNNLYQTIKKCHTGMKKAEADITNYKQSQYFKQVSINIEYNDIRRMFMKQLEAVILQQVDPIRNSISFVFCNLLNTLLSLLNNLFDNDEKRVEELEIATKEIFDRFLKRIDSIFKNQFLENLNDVKQKSRAVILDYLVGLEYSAAEGQNASKLRESIKKELISKFSNEIQPICINTERLLVETFQNICKSVLSSIDTNDNVRKQITNRFEELTKLFQLSDSVLAQGSWKFSTNLKFMLKDALKSTGNKATIAAELYDAFHPEDITKEFQKERKNMVTKLQHFIDHTFYQERQMIKSWKNNMQSMSAEAKSTCEIALLQEWIYFYEASCKASVTDIQEEIEESKMMYATPLSVTTYGVYKRKPVFIRVIDSNAGSFLDYYRELFMLNYFNSIGLNVVEVIGVACALQEETKELTIVTPYYCNGSIGEAFDKLNNLQKLFIVYTILFSVQELHSRGIAHKYIDPNFILLDENFVPYFSKFGITPSKFINDVQDNTTDYFKTDVASLGSIIQLLAYHWRKLDLVYSPPLGKSFNLDSCARDLTELGAKASQNSINLNQLLTEYCSILGVYCEALQSMFPDGLKNTFNDKITKLVIHKSASFSKSLEIIKNLEVAASFAIRSILTQEVLPRERYENYCKAYKELLVSPMINIKDEQMILDNVKILSRNLDSHALQTLSLQNCHVTKEACKIISEALISSQQLKVLNLSRNKIEDDGCEILFDGLKVNKSVTELYLRGVGLKNDGWKALGDVLHVNTSLTILDLSDNSLDETNFKYFTMFLKHSTFITKLSLKNCGITDKICQLLCLALMQNKSLVSLDLSGNKFLHEGATMIAVMLNSNTTLTSLDITRNYIGKEGLAKIAGALKEKCNLTKILLPTMDGESCSLVSDAIASNNSISYLRLGVNNFAKEQLSSLVTPIIDSIRILHLTGNHNGDEVCKLLAPALIASKTMHHIKLSFTDISSVGMRYLSKALDVNEVLQSFDISDNYIGEVGCDILGEVLKWNKSLISLNISGNFIQDKGCKFICDCLTHNTTLLFLAMNNNNITDMGAKAIQSLLSTNTTLQVLTLENNLISDTGGTYISVALGKNKTLEKLFVNDNKLQTRGCETILMCLRDNNTTIKELDISENLAKMSNITLISDVLNMGVVKRINFEGDLHPDLSTISLRQKALNAQRSDISCGFDGCSFHLSE